MMGITTYIKKRLCRGRAFSPAFPPKFWSTVGKAAKKDAAPSAARGKQIGRFTDLLFRRVVAGTVKLNPRMDTHQRCLRMFACLKRHGIRCIATQVRVCIPELNIKTELDGIGITASGTVVVLELKTTQRTTAMHKKTYNLPCKGQAKLANGLDFTSAVMYQLQTAFGILALRRLLPNNIRVGGRVIVCTSDGAISYGCQAGYMSIGLFPPMRASPTSATSSTTKNVLAKFPTDADAQKPILKLLQQHEGMYGGVVHDLRRKYGSFVANGRRDNHFLLVGLLHDPRRKGPSLTKYKTARKYLLEEKEPLRKALATKFKDLEGVPVVKCCIITFADGGYYRHYEIRSTDKPPPKKARRQKGSKK